MVECLRGYDDFHFGWQKGVWCELLNIMSNPVKQGVQMPADMLFVEFKSLVKGM